MTMGLVKLLSAKDGAFKLDGKKVLKKATGSIEYVVVDVTAPSNALKKQHLYYSGKRNSIS